MSLSLTILLFVLGLILIVKGGDWFVDSASWIAEATGIPKFIVGATIVSLATTLPEIIVSLMAASQGKVDMAIGNAVGSVTANTGLILGISLICIPAAVNRRHFNGKAFLLLLTTLILWVLCRSGSLKASLGCILFVIFLIYIAENIRNAREELSESGEERQPIHKKELPRRLLFFVLGAAGIVIGARLLVDNGSELARLMGASEALISLTFVAIGTSLPELVTTVTAIIKKQASLSVGNIVGANLIDMALILPLCAFVSGGSLPVSAGTRLLDLPVSLAFSLIALLPAMIKGKFYRWQGVVLLAGYLTYLAVLIF